MPHATLLLLSLSGLSGCREPEGATGPSVAAVIAPGSITLSYICGNSFRVRNSNLTSVIVTWDVYGSTETGTLTLPAKPSSAAHSETYFTTVKKGTVRLFEGGTLILTKANGNKPACSIPAATWPKLGAEYPDLDASRVVSDPGRGLQFYRTDLLIRFQPGTSDATKSDLLNRRNLVVLGETPGGAFFIRIPDPGAEWQQFEAVVQQLKAESSISLVMRIDVEAPKIITNTRFPTDGTGFQRLDWFSGSKSTWALRAIRAPLGWGCENGLYGTTLPRIALLENRHNASIADFGASQMHFRPATALPTSFTSQYQPEAPSALALYAEHATWTRSLLGAQGNNDIGTSGVLWASSLYLYDVVDAAGFGWRFSTGFYDIVRRLIADSPRIISISVDQLLNSKLTQDEKNAENANVVEELRVLFTRVDSAVVVVAAGNDNFIGSSVEYESRVSPQLLLSALLRLKVDYPSRIIVVAGSAEGGTFPTQYPNKAIGQGSNFFVGRTDIIAPASELTVPTTTGGTVIESGTSFSAPIVAGVLGGLLALWPSLKADTLLYYLKVGAQEPREVITTGLLRAPSPVRIPGTADVVFQVDAYGAYMAFSRSTRGAPICGLQLGVGTGAGAVGSIILRNTPEPVVVNGSGVVFTSIAQGGRRAAAAGYGLYASDLFSLTNGTWQKTGTTSDAVFFLEQDTAHVEAVASDDGRRVDLTLRIDSEKASRRVAQQLLTPPDAFPSGGGMFGGAYVAENRVSVSPTGDFVYLEWSWWVNDDCYYNLPATGGVTRKLVGLRGASDYVFESYSGTQPPCSLPADQYPPPVEGPAGGLLGWASDGRAFYYGRQYALSSPQLQRWSVEGSVQNVGTNRPTPEANEFQSLAWSPEGGRLLSAERKYYPDTCTLRARAIADPRQILEQVTSGLYVCRHNEYGPSLLRTPQVASRASVSRRPERGGSDRRNGGGEVPAVLQVN